MSHWLLFVFLETHFRVSSNTLGVREWPRIFRDKAPIVILTSSKEERDVMEECQLGVNSYIQKPVDFTRFRDSIKQVAE